MPESITNHFEQYWAVYASAAITAICLIIAILVLILVNVRYRKYANALDDATSTLRIYILDIANGNVKSFRVNNLRKVKVMSISDFYQQFPIADQKRVINWVNALSDPNTKAPNYLETDIHDRGSRKQYFSMLQLRSVDYTKQIIHVESYVLKYIPLAKNKDQQHGLSNPKQLQDAIALNGKRRGVSIAFHFVYRRIQDQNQPIDPLLFGQLKNALSPFTGPKRLLCQLSRNDLILSDLQAMEKSSVMFLARTTHNAICRFLALNGQLTLVDVRAGVVEHYAYKGEIDNIIEEAKQLSIEAFADNDPILFYEVGRAARPTLSESSFRTEVERIIHENKVSIAFRPIYSVNEEKISGYFLKPTPVNTYFDSMDDLFDYALRTGDDKALFSMVARNAVPIYINEVPDLSCKLFYPVRMDCRGYMLHAFAFTRLSKAKEAHFVFLFSEDDVKMHLDPNNLDPFIGDMRSIRAKGYEVGLLLNKGELLLPSQIYTGFDYFVCGFSFAGNAAEMDGLIRSQLHSMVEKLFKYQKPIIATDVEGWDAIEILIRSRIAYISSESFSPYDRMIVPPPPKSVKRIKDIRR